MKYVLAVLFALALSLNAWAQSHSMGKGFVVLNAAGAGNVFYDTDFPTDNPDFTGIVATIQEGQSLLLGGEVTTFPGIVDGTEVLADAASNFFSIANGSTNAFDLPPVPGPQPTKWQQANVANMLEIGAALDVGVHTLQVYFTSTDEVGHPHAPGLTIRLPSSGSFTGLIEVTEAPTGVLFACDDAADAAYDNGWTNGADGGTGFGPWIFLTNKVNDGDAAGSFVAINGPGVDNDDLNSIGAGNPPRAWGLFANEAATGGDDLQIAAAFRPFDLPMGTGQTFTIRLEHGGIQGGSLSGDTPPRTGGWVGFALRNLGPGQQDDPDPFNAFASIQHAIFAFGFRGGNANYSLYDLNNPSGLDTGIPFVFDGVEVTFHLLTATTYDLAVRTLGPNGYCTTIGNRLLTGAPIQYVAVYNRNAEEDDAFFNSLKVTNAPPVTTNLLAYDNAADPVYAATWAHGFNGGHGFGPWSMLTNQGAGSAGFFTATNPPNTNLNFVATQGRAWGTYANDFPGGGVQVASATRAFQGGALKPGQSFGLCLEHGNIAQGTGSVALVLYGAPTVGNPDGDVLTFRFIGGETNYEYVDVTGTNDSLVAFTVDGLCLEFRVTGSGSPLPYELYVAPAGGGVKRVLSGWVESAPDRAELRIVDVEEADVFWNALAIRPWPADRDGDDLPNDWEEANGTDPDVADAEADDDQDDRSNLEEYVADTNPQNSNDVLKVESISVASPVHVVFPSSSVRVYGVDYNDDLLPPSLWLPLTNGVPGTGGSIAVIDSVSTNQRNYRIRVGLAP